MGTLKLEVNMLNNSDQKALGTLASLNLEYFKVLHNSLIKKSDENDSDFKKAKMSINDSVIKT